MAAPGHPLAPMHLLSTLQSGPIARPVLCEQPPHGFFVHAAPAGTAIHPPTMWATVLIPSSACRGRLSRTTKAPAAPLLPPC